MEMLMHYLATVPGWAEVQGIERLKQADPCKKMKVTLTGVLLPQGTPHRDGVVAVRSLWSARKYQALECLLLHKDVSCLMTGDQPCQMYGDDCLLEVDVSVFVIFVRGFPIISFSQNALFVIRKESEYSVMIGIED